MKRWISAFLIAVLLLGLTPVRAASKYSRNFYGYFDTVITIMGYTESQDAFDHVCAKTNEQLDYYHKLYDGYHSYGDMHNLWYLNQHAAQAPVPVDDAMFDLLLTCREMHKEYSKVNIAMGSVLALWHDARESGVLPGREALAAAAEHMDFSCVVLDEENKTVYFTDPLLKLDLGAVAKGYTADRLKEVISPLMPSFLISLGGNVYAGDPPLDGRKKWGVSVQCPDGITPLLAGGDLLEVIYARNLSLVTSGDYQRYMTVDGVRYHHLIDPDTLQPASHLRAVTIVCESGFLADYLSTLLFILPFEEGMALVNSLPDTEALFILPDGTVVLTEGLKPMAYSHGATAR